LFNYLKKNKKLTEFDTAEKVKYLAESIKYLQDRGIAHRDIKPENIIMTNVTFILISGCLQIG
jgi:serine/threonine protein kinase